MEKLEHLSQAIEQHMPGWPHKALPLAEELLHEASREGVTLYQVYALRALAAGLGYSGRMDEAETAAEQALKLVQELDDDRLLLRCVITRGALYLAQGQHRAAHELYSRYLPRCEGPEMEAERAKLLNNLGVIARRRGDYAAALKHFLECLEIDRHQGQGAAQALTLHNLADIYHWLELHEQAEKHVREGLAILDQLGEQHGRCYLLNDLGMLEQVKGSKRQAVALHKKARQLARQQKDIISWANSLVLEAACLDAGDPQALDLLDQALELARKSADPHFLADILLQQGKRLLRMERLEAAGQCLEQAEHLCLETGSEELQCLLGETRARLLAAQGEHEQAYHQLQQNLALRDRIKGARAAQRIQAVTLPWELRALEAEKELLRLRNAELESQSRHDYLTGMANRRYLQQRLSELWSKGDLALLVLDLDFFKRINDNHSHELGDRVLQQTARLMEQVCPPDGLASRHGGEEFVMLLPGCDLQQAVQRAEQLRRAFIDHDWAALQPGLGVTVSIGVAHSAEAASAESLLQLADTRLYQAKRSGRNRVRGAQSSS